MQQLKNVALILAAFIIGGYIAIMIMTAAPYILVLIALGYIIHLIIKED